VGQDDDIVARAEEVRHAIHANPELGFEEVATQALVRDTLLAAGVPDACIRSIAKTGLVVDIVGR
jgi:metal-dependent amidase/aminoacylase/carboxypeptidase family protein